jgi:RNA polymerase sigma factor (sigma-70 family)
LLERCRKGDERAWAEIVNRYWGLAFRVAYRILRHKEEAEDAVQDAFVQVYLALRNFRHQSQFRTWFYRIVVNCALARLPPSPVESLDESQEIELVERAHEDPESVVLAHERSQLLDWAIQQFCPPTRGGWLQIQSRLIESCELRVARSEKKSPNPQLSTRNAQPK